MSTAIAEAAPMCGATATTGRSDWVCIAPAHDDDRHVFLPRYPWREAT